MNFNMAMSTPKGACKRSQSLVKRLLLHFLLSLRLATVSTFGLWLNLSLVSQIYIFGSVFKQLHVVELVHILSPAEWFTSGSSQVQEK